MEELKENPILNFNDNQLQTVRKANGYEDVNKLKQDIEQLQDWIQKQKHFKMKEFELEYLEHLLIYNKGSIERTKQRFDKLCTCINLLPDFLQNFDIRNEFRPLLNIGNICVLPKPTDDNYRIIITHTTGNDDNEFQVIDYYRYNYVMAHYLLCNDYCYGFEMIVDSRNVTFNTVAKLNPITISKGLKLFFEGLGHRTKKIHFISGSKFFDTILILCKQVLSAKLKQRVKVHPNVESLYDHIPREQLPADFGGDERSLKELSEMIYKELCSDTHIARVKLMESAATDESFRPVCEFNEEYSGMPGRKKRPGCSVVLYESANKNLKTENQLDVPPPVRVRSGVGAMEELKENPILNFNENQLQIVRKAHGYEDVNKLKQDIEQLKDWIQKQNHFKVKEFDPEYLERLLIYNKGSIERTKQRFDKLCTCINLMPDFLQNFDIRNEFRPLLSIGNFCVLPKPTNDNYRVIITHANGNDNNEFQFIDYYRYHLMIGHYMLYNDYCHGFEMIADSRKITFGTVSKFNPITINKGLTLLVEAMGQRLKKIHLLSGSKFFDTVLLIFKQGLSAKLKQRLIVHPNPESLYNHIPREQLPVELGGDERSVKELSDMDFKEWSSDTHIANIKFMESAATDESFRLACKFNEEYSGMPGSFKTLCVD